MFTDSHIDISWCLINLIVLLFSALATANEFEYELNFNDRDSQENLQNSVALTLVRARREEVSGLVVLVFNVVFAPFKAMR